MFKKLVWRGVYVCELEKVYLLEKDIQEVDNAVLTLY